MEKKTKMTFKAEKKQKMNTKPEEKDETSSIKGKEVTFRGVVVVRGYSKNGILYAVGFPIDLSDKLGLMGGEIVKVSVGFTGKNIISERAEKRKSRVEKTMAIKGVKG